MIYRITYKTKYFDETLEGTATD